MSQHKQQEQLDKAILHSPGLRVATRHETGSPASALLSPTDTGTDIEQSLRFEVFASSVGIGKGRVASIDDYVAGFQKGDLKTSR